MRIAKTCNALVIPLAMLLAGASQAAGLQAYTATYDVARNGSAIGNATVTLKQASGGWAYESQTRGTSGLARMAALDVNEHSDVRDNGGILETRSYRYRQSSLVSSRTRSIDVNAATGRIVSVDKKKGTQEFATQPGVLDRQSVTLGIANDLAAGKRGTLSYGVADASHVGTERYQVGKEQTINVPAGSIRTINVTRLRDSGGGRITTSWFGLDNGFVPVRIVQTEPGGETYEMTLVSLRK